MYKVSMTNGVSKRMNEDSVFCEFIGSIYIRFIKNDWGILSEEDIEQNNISVKNDGMILGNYQYNENDNVWIIKDAYSDTVTILLPEEY